MSDLYARLAAFLDARLDREEFLAREHENHAHDGPSLLAGRKRQREIGAMREIVRRCTGVMNEMDVYPNGLVSPRALLARQTLTWLGAIWSDHADYDQEWKP